MNSLLFAIAAYLLGSLSFAIVVSKLFRIADPRTFGSGNPGATNVLRTGNKAAAALTLVMGGALGNVIDRVRFGAVVDFIQWHAAGYYWPAFNVADSAITLGAVLLLLAQLGGSGQQQERNR
jgi:hypothetical protein